MYVFNKITVTPQLPDRIKKLATVAGNLWWTWNTDFLKLFKQIDGDLWETVGKNPVKFLRLVSQDRLESAAKDSNFLKDYDRIVENFEDYMNSKNTWFKKNYPDNSNDLIAYFSAEYGLDQILSIYSGGLGVLSGDHLKSASDLGIPLVAVGLLYKNGFFHQKINGYGQQQEEYKQNDVDSLPIHPVKDVEGKDLLVYVNLPKKRLYLKVWQINVGRIKLYLLDQEDKPIQNKRALNYILDYFNRVDNKEFDALIHQAAEIIVNSHEVICFGIGLSDAIAKYAELP